MRIHALPCLLGLLACKKEEPSCTNEFAVQVDDDRDGYSCADDPDDNDEQQRRAKRSDGDERRRRRRAIKSDDDGDDY